MAASGDRCSRRQIFPTPSGQRGKEEGSAFIPSAATRPRRKQCYRPSPSTRHEIDAAIAANIAREHPLRSDPRPEDRQREFPLAALFAARGGCARLSTMCFHHHEGGEPSGVISTRNLDLLPMPERLDAIVGTRVNRRGILRELDSFSRASSLFGYENNCY